MKIIPTIPIEGIRFKTPKGVLYRDVEDREVKVRALLQFEFEGVGLDVLVLVRGDAIGYPDSMKHAPPSCGEWFGTLEFRITLELTRAKDEVQGTYPSNQWNAGAGPRGLGPFLMNMPSREAGMLPSMTDKLKAEIWSLTGRKFPSCEALAMSSRTLNWLGNNYVPLAWHLLQALGQQRAS